MTITTITTDATPTPMYASFVTFTTLLDWLAEMPTIPSKIDRSLWSQKFNGSNGAQLVAGMRFLGLLEGETPQKKLIGLVRASGDERRDLIEQMLRDAYGEALIDGLPAATPKMVDDAIRERGSTEATHRKAVAFFINATKATNLEIPTSVAKRARNRRAGSGRPRSNPAGPVRPSTPNNRVDTGRETGGTPSRPSPHSVRLPSGGLVTVSIDANVWSLTDAERAFIFKLVDHVRQFAAQEPNPADQAAVGENSEAAGA